jgi:hypothetical protein
MKTDPLPATEKKPPKLRWYQWRLRSMFILTLVVAIGMSWIAVTMRHQRRQKAAAEEIEKAGGSVQCESTWLGRLMHDDSLVSVTSADFSSRSSERVNGVMVRMNGEPISDRSVTDKAIVHLQGLHQLQSLSLASSLVSDNGLTQLTGLEQLGALKLDNTEVTDAGLPHLRRLSQLRVLSLALTNVTDAGLVHLQGLSQLQTLDLSGTKVTDDGLEHLDGLTNLEWLLLGNTDVTDAGLLYLQRLTQLQALSLLNTKVTDAGIKKLQQALPNCKIER